MPLAVYTANIRYLKAKQQHALDVTRMGTWLARKAGEPVPGEPFAPSWPLLKDAKEGKLEFGEYDRLYTAEMRISAGMRPGHHQWNGCAELGWSRGVRPCPDAWRWLLAQSAVVLCCYCPHTDCHRTLLRTKILPAMGAVDCGEITKWAA